MEKVSVRIWLLIAGIAVAIAIAVSAIAMDRQVLPSHASKPVPPKGNVSTFPAILLKSIHAAAESPLRQTK